MSGFLRGTITGLIGLSVALATSSTAVAGKDHCRTIELTGAAGPASADVVDIQVTDYLGNILDRSCQVTVEPDECADDLAKRLVGKWGNGAEDLSQVGCSSDLGEQTCGKNSDMDACILDPGDPICATFCKHKYKKGKVKGGNSAIEELALLGECPSSPPNGEKAERGEFKKFPKIEICCFEAKDEGVIADPTTFDYTDTTHCKGKPLGKTLTSPQRLEVSLFDRIDRPNVFGDGIHFEPKLPDNSLDVPVGLSSRQISLDPIGFLQKPGTNLRDCRADITRGVDSLIRTSTATLTRCHKEVIAGKTVADCNTVNAQSDPDGKIAAAAQAIEDFAIDDCEGPDVSFEGPRTSPSVYGLRGLCPASCGAIDLGVCSFGLFGNGCVSDRDCDTSPGAADGKCGLWADAADCASCLVENAVTTAVSELYGSPGPGPSTPPGAAKCFDAIGKSLEFIVRTNVSETLSCQKKADAAKTALPENAPYCKDTDLKGNRAKALAKIDSVIDKACQGVDIASLNLCGGATTTGDLQTCMRVHATAINDSLARAALPEQIDLCGNGTVDPGEECDGIDGLCPGNCLFNCTCAVCPVGADIEIRPGTGGGAVTNPTDIERGWGGLGHADDWPEGVVARVDLDCPGSVGSCGQCSVEGVSSSGPQTAAYLRCADDVSVRCSAPSASDPACGGSGCRFWLAPPIPRAASGTATCSLMGLEAPPVGTLDPDLGAVALTIQARDIAHVGESQVRPCPLCSGDSGLADGVPDGACTGGARDGLPCDTQATDATFAPGSAGVGLSLDCPPDPVRNVSGSGLPLTFDLSTGSSSLPYGLPCDPPLSGLSCPCAVCSLDPTIACTQDADCSGVGAGVCAGSGGGQAAPRQPNGCSDLNCTSLGGGRGSCQGGPGDVNTYCDGHVRADGSGLLLCLNNGDCTAQDPQCSGNDCGDCTISQNRPCFPDPIDAAGVPDVTAPVVSGTTCLAGTTNAAINAAFGLPGPERLTLQLETTYR